MKIIIKIKFTKEEPASHFGANIKRITEGKGNVQFSGLIIQDTNSNILFIMNSTRNKSNRKRVHIMKIKRSIDKFCETIYN